MKKQPIRRKINMPDKWNYNSVSLKKSTFSKVNNLTSKLLPGIQLSNAMVVEKLVIDADSKFSRENKRDFTNEKNIKA
tara:strand:+ start:1265 stop:1498 length:234 start_codon:yes stop_codon:yes gene_type:complete